MRPYITEIKISGIKNIKNEINIQFYKKTLGKFFEPEKNGIKAIYGPNGAGKSAIIQAVDIYQNITFNKGYLYSSESKVYLTEIINKECNEFNIEVTFIVYEQENYLIQGQYKHAVRIIMRDGDFYIDEEELVKVLTRSEKTLLKTKGGEIISDELGEKITGKMVNMLQKRSAIDIIKNDKINYNEYSNVKKDVFAFLLLVVSILTETEMSDKHSLFIARKKTEQFPSEEIVEAVRHVNSNYAYSFNKRRINTFEKYVARLEKFVKIFKKDLVKIEIEYKYDKDLVIAELYYVYNGYKVYLEFESAGIKKLARLFNLFELKESGAIVFIDEFDANINDVYLIKLLEFFIDEPTGQLIFTTHNITPMQTLNENNHSIDFITEDGEITKWKKTGNSTPANVYQKGLIEGLPFNIHPFNFVGVFDSDEE